MNEELIELIEEESVELIDIEESAGWTVGDTITHNSLPDRDAENQHPIAAIEGLEERLDNIEALKTVESDKLGFATYYKWKTVPADRVGCFVTLVSGDEIEVCKGSDIFGVTVDPVITGFAGNQNNTIARGNDYGLVATFGMVEVRCEAGIKVNDYIVSNNKGIATKTETTCGYKVVATATRNDIPYAIISLGVQACTTDAMGANIKYLQEHMATAEANIAAVTNTANEAYNKAKEDIELSEAELKQAIEELNKKTDDTNTELGNMNDALTDTNAIAQEANTIAATALTNAEQKARDVCNEANDVWEANADKIIKETHSLCAKIDQYSVGEYSQAYGLTFMQAQSILKEGMIYVPTSHEKISPDDSKQHTEKYEYTNNAEYVEQWSVTGKDTNKVYYTDSSNNLYTYWYHADGAWKNIETVETLFVPGWLYMWSKLDGDVFYRWVTVDKNYNQTAESASAATAPVWMSNREPELNTDDYRAYWYTDCQAEDIKDATGAHTDDYEAETLYKWEDGHWLAVATLKGNISNRMVSDVWQTTNGITMGVSNPHGCIAAISAELDDTKSQVQSLTKFVGGTTEDGKKHYNLTGINQTSDGSGSSIALYATHMTTEGEAEEIELSGAHIVLGQDENKSYLSLDADYVNFETGSFKLNAGCIDFDTNEFTIDATHIEGKLGGWTIGDTSLSASNESKDEGGNVVPATYRMSLNASNIGSLDSIINVTDVANNNNIFTLSGQGRMWANDAVLGFVQADSALIGNTNDNLNLSGDMMSFNGSLSSGSRAYFTSNELKFTGMYPSDVIGSIASNQSISTEKCMDVTGMWKFQNGVKIWCGNGTVPSKKATAGLDFYNDSGNVWTGSIWIPTNDDGQMQVLQLVTPDTHSLYLYGGAGGELQGENGWAVTNDLTVRKNLYPTQIVFRKGEVLDSTTNRGQIWMPDDYNALQLTTDGSLWLHAGAGGQLQGEYGWTVTKDLDVGGDLTVDGDLTVNGSYKINTLSISPQLNFQDGALWVGSIWKASTSSLQFKTRDNYGLWLYGGEGNQLQGKDWTVSGALVIGDIAKITNAYLKQDLAEGKYTLDDGDLLVCNSTYLNSSAIIPSDRNLKNSIVDMPKQYDVLFDNLRPVIHKYNDGTSDRYHTGYIAQEVGDALVRANLTRQDFAGLCVINEGSELERWGLRYSEFIPLNTYEIQKLKTRVLELETQIAELK